MDDPDQQIILNTTGGFKSTVPYLTLYGLLHRLPVVYLLEQSDALLTLPPAPIQFDYGRLSQAADALTLLRQVTCLGKEEFFKLIPGVPHHDRAWYESLLEEEGAVVTLSAFGLLLVEAVQKEQAEVSRHPSAELEFGIRGVHDRVHGHLRDVAHQEYNLCGTEPIGTRGPFRRRHVLVQVVDDLLVLHVDRKRKMLGVAGPNRVNDLLEGQWNRQIRMHGRQQRNVNRRARSCGVNGSDQRHLSPSSVEKPDNARPHPSCIGSVTKAMFMLVPLDVFIPVTFQLASVKSAIQQQRQIGQTLRPMVNDP